MSARQLAHSHQPALRISVQREASITFHAVSAVGRFARTRVKPVVADAEPTSSDVSRVQNVRRDSHTVHPLLRKEANCKLAVLSEHTTEFRDPRQKHSSVHFGGP